METPIAIQSCLVRLEDLFARMDQAYDAVAARSGFQCRGCEDNCCRSLFYHHTVAEYLFLRQGLRRLSDSSRAQVRERALRRLTVEAPGADPGAGGMCPLNEAGLCILHAHRPMICRLHGIPHFLRRPDGALQTGPGCNAFYSADGRADTARLDRTPWYAGLSQLEGELRRAVGFERRVKLTIAGMLVEEVRDLEIYI